MPCDLADRDALAALPERAAEALGAPAILVHCGGITRDGLALRMKDEDWQEVLEVNLSAGFVLARACLRGMIRQRWGRLVFITSVVGTTGNAGQANYAASKAGLAGMVKALAAETAARGVTANCVAPGFIETAMTDAWRTRRRKRFSARSRPGASARGAMSPPPASTSRARRPATSPGRRSTSTAAWRWSRLACGRACRRGWRARRQRRSAPRRPP